MSRRCLLVLRALGLGDLLTGVPALRGLRRAFPAHEIVLAAPRSLAPLAAATGAVDRLLPAAGPDRPAWRGLPPDITVNLHGRGPRSHRGLVSLSARRLLAFACPEAGLAEGPRWRSDEHEVTRWCRMLAWYGIVADPAELRLPVPQQGAPAEPPAPSAARPIAAPVVAVPSVAAPAVASLRGAVVVHPGAGYASKRWPPGRYAWVAQALAGEGHRVVVTGSTEERGLAASVARMAGLPESAVIAGRTPLAELAAIVAHARLVICGDTGIGHLASAYGTPSVLIFGPLPPRWWGPPPGGPHRVLWRGAVTGPGAATGGPERPGAVAGGPEPPGGGSRLGLLRGGPHPALLAVTTHDVYSAVREVLRAETRRGTDA